MIRNKDFRNKQVDGNYPFGVDPAAVAAGLRKMAGQIDRGYVVVQAFTLCDVSSNEEFSTTTLSVNFNQKVKTHGH